MRIIAVLLAFVLFLGCLGGEGRTVENKTVENETKNKTPAVQIIVGPQQNQTTPGQYEEEQEQEEQQEENRTTELEYDSIPEAPMGIFFIDSSDEHTHGNSILIKKGDLDVVIDAGPEDKGGIVVDFLNSREVDDIEILVSTNPDPRNYGGLNTVADNFEIEHFWWNGDYLDDFEYYEFVKRMEEEAKEVRFVEKGYSEELSGINFEVLNPYKSSDRFGNVNNDAIVLRVTNGEFTALLTSGIQKGAMQKIVTDQEDKIQNQIFQAPYYGTGEGTRDIGLVLLAVDPEYVIITGSEDDSAENGGSREPFFRLLDQYGIPSSATYDNTSIRITNDGSDMFAVQYVVEEEEE